MKSNNIKIYLGIAVIILLVNSSCEGIQDRISVTLPVEPDPIEFSLTKQSAAMAPAQVAAENTLFETTLKTNLNTLLADEGYSLDNLKAFKIESVIVEAKAPTTLDMSQFIGMKLYFGSDKKLIAEAKSVGSNNQSLVFTINQADIFSYASVEQLPVLITGPALTTANQATLAMKLKCKATVKPN
ncbi:MAG: hypothetical protein ACK5KP_05915 [Paludibacteraceae bacterium]